MWKKKSFEKIQNILWSLEAVVSLIISLLLAVGGELSCWEAWREAGPGGDSREEGGLLVLPGHWSRSGLSAGSEEDKPGVWRGRGCNGGAGRALSQVGLFVTSGNIASSLVIAGEHQTSGQALGWDDRAGGCHLNHRAELGLSEWPCLSSSQVLLLVCSGNIRGGGGGGGGGSWLGRGEHNRTGQT